MIINDLTSAGAMPALEKMLLFSGGRQRIIANNIANIDTPNYQGMDVDPKGFQKLLGEAIESRRARNGGAFGALELKQNRQVQSVGGRMVLNAETPTAGVLFQDRNQRDLERLMQQLVENASAFRVASDFMRKSSSQLKLAIAQRVL